MANLETQRETEVARTNAQVEAPSGSTIDEAGNRVVMDARNTSSSTTAAELPPLSIEAVNYAQANFNRMDGNGDGHVSDYELDGYIKANERTMSEAEKKLVYSIKDHRSNLEEASNDEWLDENDGFTKQDLAAARTGATASTTGEGVEGDKTSGDLRPALNYVNKNFEKMDGDGDGFVNNDEISQFMANNELSADEQRMLNNLQSNSASVETGHNDGPNAPQGISKKDLSNANEQINNLTFAVENFTAMDADGNGHVTTEEITGYEKARGDLTSQERRALADLKNKVGHLEEANNDELGDEDSGYTGHDLNAALSSMGSFNAKGQKEFDKLETTKPAAAEKPEETLARTHTVSKGETLWKICADELRQRNGGRAPTNQEIVGAVDAVVNFNPNLSRHTIQPGQEIKIPKDLSAPAERRAETQPPQRRAEPRPEPTNPRAELPREEPRVPTEEPKPEVVAANPAPERELSDPDVLRKHWENIDRSGDDRVSREEIQAYMRVYERQLSDKEKASLSRMAAREGKIQELVNDERGDENSGMSRNDLRQAEQMQAAAKHLLTRNLDVINRNGDRFVDRNEITQALMTRDMPPQDRARLNYLRAYYSKFQEGANNERGDENSGVSIQDLQYYANLV